MPGESGSTLGSRDLPSAATNPHFLAGCFLQSLGGSGEVLLDLLRIHPLRFVGHFLLDGVQGIEILIEGLILRFHCITSNGVWINNTCSYPPRTFTPLKRSLFPSFSIWPWFHLTTISRPATV